MKFKFKKTVYVYIIYNSGTMKLLNNQRDLCIRVIRFN